MKRVVLLALVLSCSVPAQRPTGLSFTLVQGDAGAGDAGDIPPYDRAAWGNWVDADHDCQSTRQEVLLRQSLEPVVFADPSKPCKIVSGKWVDPYTGQTFTDPTALEIDHVVPVYQAYYSGGYLWDATKKNAYYNDLTDPEALMAVSISANRSKGDRTPAQWLPPNEADRCSYVLAWTRVKIVWGLTIAPDEAASLVQLIGTYCSQAGLKK